MAGHRARHQRRPARQGAGHDARRSCGVPPRGPALSSASAPAASGRRTRLLLLLGPAFVAAIAYVDPGNVAANVSAGARYGYLLVWVLVAANAMAAVVQYASARLGILTGRTLPDLLGERLPRPARLLYFAQAEIVAAATDVAEVIGGAIGLQLLFGLPLVAGGVVVGGVSLLLLVVQSRGQRAFEAVVLALLAVLAVGFAGGVFTGIVDWRAAAAGLVPRFDGGGSVVLAASMLGATVMPHVVYLHSALARDRHRGSRTPTDLLLRATRLDVGLALLLAGAVNVALLVLAAAALRGSDVSTIEGAQHLVATSIGPVVGVLFAVGLLASGLASSSVGAYAGSVVLSGLLHVRVPVIAQRAVVLIPALVLLAIGADPTATLIASQAVLAIGIPFALVPLVRLNCDPRVVGDRVLGVGFRVLAWTVAALIVVLDGALVAFTATGAA